jgi:hypothetical protein
MLLGLRLRLVVSRLPLLFALPLLLLIRITPPFTGVFCP